MAYSKKKIMGYNKVQKISMKLLDRFRKEFNDDADNLGFIFHGYEIDDDFIKKNINDSEDFLYHEYKFFKEINIEFYSGDVGIDFTFRDRIGIFERPEYAGDQYRKFKYLVQLKNQEYNELKMKYDLLEISLDSQEKAKRRI